MRWIFITFLALAGIVGAGAAFIYVAFPTDFVRDELAARVRDRTGRSLSVSGPISIALYPEAMVELDGVSVAPPAGMTGEPTLSIGVLRLKAPLWPLLWHKLTVEGFELIHPVIVLRTDMDGRRSWDLRKEITNEPHLRGSAADITSPASVPAASTKDQPPKPRRSPDLAGLQLRDVHIASGTIKLIDDRSGLNETLSDVSVELNLDDVEAPVQVQGSATWNGEETKFHGSAGPASNLIAGDPALVDITTGGRLANGMLKAKFSPAEQTPFTGHLDLTSRSLRDLLRWLKEPLPGSSGFGQLTATADFGLSSAGIAARNANLKIDGSTAKGDFSVIHGKEKLMIRANLTMDQLNLNTYLSGDAAGGAAEAPAASAEDASKPESEKPSHSEDAGWSDEPIDLSALRRGDADVTLSVGGLQWHAIKTGNAALHSVVSGGLMKTRLSDIALYAGRGAGSVTLDGRQTTPRVESDFALHGIQVQPLLADTLGFGQLAGQGELSFGMMATGRSQREMVKGLMGQGRIELADGAIAGFDLTQDVRDVETGHLGNLKNPPSAKTGFSSMTASCSITNGVLDNRDLTISAPLLRLSGAGTVSLSERTIDYTAQSSLVDSTKDQGAVDAGPAALTVPLKITGPWTKPAIAFDLNTIAKNPQAALDSLKKVVGKFAGTKQGKAVGDFIGGLLGKPKKNADPATDQDAQQ